MEKKITKKNTKEGAISNGMEAKVYNTKGKEVRTLELPESIFGVKWNSDLVHNVVVSMQSNARENVAHVKTRGEVAGGGRKPWQQKGTGRARHGSIRSPIWVGGGVTHGPNPFKNYSRKVNRKEKVSALFSILSKKFKDGEILFVDSISVPSAKTKDAKTVIKSLSGIKGYESIATKPKNAAFLTMPKKDKPTFLSLRNFSNICLDEVRNMNPVELLSHKLVVITDPDESFKILSAKKNTK